MRTENKTFHGPIVVMAMMSLAGCVINRENLSHPRLSVKGQISGIVVDSKQRTVPGAEVGGFYIRSWTIGPFADNYMVASAWSDSTGRFLLSANTSVNSLYAWIPKTGYSGKVHSVTQDGNVIEINK